jgi:uncharacterized protein YkwD
VAANGLPQLNLVRKNNGRSELRLNALLTAAANKYARFMAERNFFAHDGVDGSTPQGRVVAAGYSGDFKGEALAAGQTSVESAISTWMTSPSHAAILLDPAAVEVGIGYFYLGGSHYGHYWVLVTGIP